MDGITSVRHIMKECPTPIVMFSSLTHDGAKATLDALEAGALDFLPKKFEDIAKDKKEGTKVLQDRVRALGRRSGAMRRKAASPLRTLTSNSSLTKTPASSSLKTATRTVKSETSSQVVIDSRSAVKPSTPVRKSSGKRYKLLAIGTSTGGPVALQKVLTGLPANLNMPIIIIQHMPAAFTPAFAVRLNSLCRVKVKEAEHGDVLKPGTAYLAPGGKQMLLEGRSASPTIKILEDESAKITYKPSVDLSFGSAAKVYGGDVLGVILTGMGADGREGSRMLKQHGAKIWAQDEQSCVVYGMPQAVTVAGIAEENIALNDMSPAILKELDCG
jgi:two-component system chemotaxis response regulator CheB